MKSRLPRGVARRIDRLARGAHAFHRFAHHPLCNEYASELVPLGRRVRVCRGCLHVAIGSLLGAALGLVQINWPPSMLLTGATLFCVATLLWMRSRKSPSTLSNNSWRQAKFFTRSLPLGCAAFAIVAGLRSFTAVGAIAAIMTAGIVVAAFVAYRQLGPRRAPCAVCPERSIQPCRGYRPIWRRERAFTRRAQQLIAGNEP